MYKVWEIVWKSQRPMLNNKALVNISVSSIQNVITSCCYGRWLGKSLFVFYIM